MAAFFDLEIWFASHKLHLPMSEDMARAHLNQYLTYRRADAGAGKPIIHTGDGVVDLRDAVAVFVHPPSQERADADGFVVTTRDRLQKLEQSIGLLMHQLVEVNNELASFRECLQRDQQIIQRMERRLDIVEASTAQIG